MRILYHSAAPWVNTGYGHCTREIATRLHNLGHDVAIKPLGAVNKGGITWHGEESPVTLRKPMKVYSSEGAFGLGSVVDNFNDFNADIYFTHFDTWIQQARNSIPEMGIPYASYAIVDHYPVPDAVVQQLYNAQRTVAMSEYGKSALAQKGVPSVRIPHGVDTDTYKPLTGDDKPHTIYTENESGDRTEIDLDETFVVGMVAANHGDRKHIPGQMEAFAMFLNEVTEDAIMYIHTDAAAAEGYNLNDVRREIGLPKEKVVWPGADMYHDLDDEGMAKWYNAFDVFINCSYGESWGMCITEAMSCGVPSIVTNFSAMPEQVGSNNWNEDEPIYDEIDKQQPSKGGVRRSRHGLVVDHSVGVYRARVSAKQFIVSPIDIKDAIEYYYNNPNVREDHSKKARDYVLNNYTWEDHVVPEFDKMFNNIEEEL